MSTSLIALVKPIGTILLYLITGVVSMTAGMLFLVNTKFGRKNIKNTILLLNNTKFGKKVVKKLVKEGKE